MKKEKYSKFDWEKFIDDLSYKTPETQELIFQNTKRLYLKENPEFSTDFIKRLKELSYNKERKFYYEQNNVSSEIIKLFEDSFGIYPGNLEKNVQKVIGEEFWKMSKWGSSGAWTEEKKSTRLTRIWFYGPDFLESVPYKFSVPDRLFILQALVLTGSLKNMSLKYQPKLEITKQLAIVFGEPQSTIKGALKKISDHFNFEEMLKKWKASSNLSEIGLNYKNFKKIRDSIDFGSNKNLTAYLDAIEEPIKDILE